MHVYRSCGYMCRSCDLYEYMCIGHVIFEMCTGMDLRTTIPVAKDYQEIPRELQPLLKYIFDGRSANISRVRARSSNILELS